MPKLRGPEMTSFPTERRKLAYMDKFRAMLHEKPGMIKTATELMNRAIDDYHPESFEYRPGQTVRYDKPTNTWLINEPGHEVVLDERGQPVLDEKGKYTYREFDEQPFYYGRGTLLVPGEPVADQATGVSVTVLGRSNRDLVSNRLQTERRVDKTDYFKVDINGIAYFVKYATVTQNPGFDEFQATHKAKELLADLLDVEVVEAQLGYQDDQHSWYVASWKKLETAGYIPYDSGRLSNDYGKYVERPKRSQLPTEKYQQIEERLRAAHLDGDLETNLFFIPSTDRFFLLDVTSENRKGIRQPYRDNPQHPR